MSWHEIIKAIQDCKDKEEKAKEEGRLVFNGKIPDGKYRRDELTDYMNYDEPTQLRNKQMDALRQNYLEEKSNHSFNIVIFIFVIILFAVAFYFGGQIKW